MTARDKKTFCEKRIVKPRKTGNSYKKVGRLRYNIKDGVRWGYGTEQYKEGDHCWLGRLLTMAVKGRGRDGSKPSGLSGPGL